MFLKPQRYRALTECFRLPSTERSTALSVPSGGHRQDMAACLPSMQLPAAEQVAPHHLCAAAYPTPCLQNAAGGPASILPARHRWRPKIDASVSSYTEGLPDASAPAASAEGLPDTSALASASAKGHHPSL
ncbi:hypothetical protein CRENBAI_020113 [Crenichthys baileyi]|uniref:Uncharacterized protein n=1 Tax=Crenichthys baileyi TaxID=28760 RepID=A0AAV9SKS0_9TELE